MAKEKMMMPTSADSFPKALKEKIERCTTRKQAASASSSSRNGYKREVRQ